MGRCVGQRLLAGVACCLALSAVGAQDTKATIEGLRKAGKPQEALTVAEAAVRNASTVEQSWAYVWLADSIAYNDLPPAKRIAYYQHVYETFADRPAMYLFGATLYSESLALMADPALVNPPKAVEVATKALEALKSFQPRDNHFLIRLYSARMRALLKVNKLDEAKAWLTEVSNTVPLALGNKHFQRGLVEYGAAQSSPEAIVGMARLIYVLSDYTDADVKDALKRVSGALAAAEGPGAALQFAKAQEDTAVPNPLKRYPVLVLGDPDKMLAAAGDNYAAKFVVLLHLDRLGEAVVLAKQQMVRSAASPGQLAQSLKDLARCFRARDLSLVRANRFLEFHRTGDGDNPLPALEAELKPAAAAPAAGK